jgi:nucleotide-binding universal stress UspA family protein
MPVAPAFKRILVPTDFGKAASRALDVAVDLAEKYDATVRLLHTYEVPSYPYPDSGVAAVDLLTPIHDAVQAQLDQALLDLRKRSPAARACIVAYGVAWREILRATEEDQIDLIVMGTHGRHRVDHTILGSVAEKVVRLSKVPVLTVRSSH